MSNAQHPVCSDMWHLPTQGQYSAMHMASMQQHSQVCQLGQIVDASRNLPTQLGFGEIPAASVHGQQHGSILALQHPKTAHDMPAGPCLPQPCSTAISLRPISMPRHSVCHRNHMPLVCVSHAVCPGSEGSWSSIHEPQQYMTNHKPAHEDHSVDSWAMDGTHSCVMRPSAEHLRKASSCKRCKQSFVS